MWRSRSALHRSLFQLFDSGSRRGTHPGHGSFLGRAGACPWRSLCSSEARPLSEDVAGVGTAEESQDSDKDPYSDMDMRDSDDPTGPGALFGLDVCSNQTLTWKTRYQGIAIISRVARYDPDAFEFYELVNPTLQAMFRLLVSEDDVGYVRSPRIAAREIIETMALKHPERVLPPVLEFASKSSQDTDPKHREAAVSALGDIAEGCSALMKGEMEPLLGIVLGAHRDTEQTVRAAASYALHKFAEHLQPEIVSRHQSVLPCILNALDDDHFLIEWHSYDSLEALCDNMTREEILPFLDPIMDKLFSELRCGSYDRKLRSAGAMSSVAAAAGQDFVPYAERVLETMTPLLALDGFLRTQDFVFAGVLAKTVGRAGLEPMLAPYIEAAISAARIPGRHQRRHLYGFFCNAAETLGDGFAKYLPGVVPLAISSCNLDEAATRSHPESASIERMEVLDEKAAATRALGLFAVHTKSAFAPYLEQSTSVMINHSAHDHEAVRLQGVIGLKNIRTAVAAVSESRRASPFSELRRSVEGPSRPGAFDPIFIERKVQEDVAAESRGSHRDGATPWPLFLPRPLRDNPIEFFARFALEVCSNQTLTWKTLCQAAEEIIYYLEYSYPDSLEKYELVAPILQAMFPLLALKDDEVFENSPDIAARSVIKIMASNHPEQVFSPVLEFASLSSRDTNPNYRAAASYALCDIAEKCSQLMKDKLEPLLGIVLGALRDAEHTVRAAASCALHQFAEHLQPEIVSRHQSVLPCILNALEEDSESIEEPSFKSLEALCGNMTGEEILPFLDPIMSTLLPKLQRRTYHRLYHMLCVHAMRSVAAAAGQDFLPYAKRVLESMKPHLVLTGTECDDPRTGDFLFSGLLARTVWRAGEEPMIAPYVEAAISATANRWNQEYGHCGRRDTFDFFCSLWKYVLSAEVNFLEQYLPCVVPLAISSCNLDESKTHRHHRQNVLDEKAAATRALGLFAAHTKSAFAPYLEESMSIMINHSAHYHEDVRLQGVNGLKNVLTAAAAVSESLSDGAAKKNEVLGTVMDRYIKAMDEDGDKRVVAQVCTNMIGILEDFGYAALEPYTPQIMDSASQLLRGQSACQQADDGERDEALMAAVSNLLPALAKASEHPNVSKTS